VGRDSSRSQKKITQVGGREAGQFVAKLGLVAEYKSDFRRKEKKSSDLFISRFISLHNSTVVVIRLCGLRGRVGSAAPTG
jgi:hypothetical protein